MKQDQFSKWNATKVKAKYDYACARCGSTENIQAHDPTGEHRDWRLGIALCGQCHSLEHPDISTGLFSSKTHQPYWPNISARSLAKEMGCHNRTVIRRAKKLGIPMGKPLSPKDKSLIVNLGISASPSKVKHSRQVRDKPTSIKGSAQTS